MNATLVAIEASMLKNGPIKNDMIRLSINQATPLQLKNEAKLTRLREGDEDELNGLEDQQLQTQVTHAILPAVSTTTATAEDQKEEAP